MNCVSDTGRSGCCSGNRGSEPLKSYTHCKATAATPCLPIATTNRALELAPSSRGVALEENFAAFILPDAEILFAGSGREVQDPGAHRHTRRGRRPAGTGSHATGNRAPTLSPDLKWAHRGPLRWPRPAAANLGDNAPQPSR
ncbi:hypothetical protein P7K49_021135, partial [Saguinus oedipus]